MFRKTSRSKPLSQTLNEMKGGFDMFETAITLENQNMTEIRRYFRENDTIFLTHVTHERMPILITHFDLLWTPIERAERHSSLEIVAWAVLPDHFHLLVRSTMNDVSMIMKKIKLSFSTSYRKAVGRRHGRVWQYRFWDHIIRNEEDMNRHIDYIHFNPVKHGLVASPFEWRHSSIHDYLKDGYYNRDWGAVEIEGTFGE